ncbi:hypothetical protein [Spiroplasma endosymbiont of Nebria brevicollis]|uniref:hypothetical protein n=1 Tax=Spiroplasma endosymbiont of Nebria brevicollis TaxID=3066284 RepID=UPI00313B86AA
MTRFKYGNNIIISKSQNIKLKDTINQISSNHTLIKNQHLKVKHNEINNNLSCYRLDNIVFDIMATINYTGPNVVVRELKKLSWKPIYIHKYLNNDVSKGLTMIIWNSAANLNLLTRLRYEDISFTDTIESNVSSTSVYSEKYQWEELSKSLNKESETNKNTNESSIKHAHEMFNLEVNHSLWQQVNDSAQYLPPTVNNVMERFLRK